MTQQKTAAEIDAQIQETIKKRNELDADIARLQVIQNNFAGREKVIKDLKVTIAQYFIEVGELFDISEEAADEEKPKRKYSRKKKVEDDGEDDGEDANQ